jgi:hypothetical protein
METNGLADFLTKAAEQTEALDKFVDAQRAVATSVRARDWPGLEVSIKRAGAYATMVSASEFGREEAWGVLLAKLGLPADSSVFRVSLAIPMEYRSLLTDAYRSLRLAAMRARIENEALSDFVGSSASTLNEALEALYPERKGKIYGRSGRTRKNPADAMILDAAF